MTKDSYREKFAPKKKKEGERKSIKHALRQSTLLIYVIVNSLFWRRKGETHYYAQEEHSLRIMTRKESGRFMKKHKNRICLEKERKW